MGSAGKKTTAAVKSAKDSKSGKPQNAGDIVASASSAGPARHHIAAKGAVRFNGAHCCCKLSADGRTLTIRIPFKLTERGGRKLVIAPNGTHIDPAIGHSMHRIDNAMIKAIARAFRWRKLLETRVHTSIEDIATAEKINPSYVSRILRLTLLAPNIVEAILNGTQPPALQLDDLLKVFPVEWDGQREMFDVV